MSKYQEALDNVRKVYAESYHYDEEDIRLLQELVDKETPMKVGKIQPVVLEEDIKNYGNARFNLCPKCQRIVYPFHISDYSKIKYCENCGQRLDWSDSE